MLKGQLWATSDIGLVDQALLQGFKVIYLGDPISIKNTKYQDLFVVATSLVPDYQTLSLQVDGDERGFVDMYIASLNSKAAIEMLSVIFVCLFKGINIMFFLPPDASGLNYIQYLLEYIKLNYGIQTQTKTTQFTFNPQFSNKIIELLYLNNLVSSQEFLINSDTLDDISLRKLVEEIHPMVNNPQDINEIIQWFSNFKDALIVENRPLVNGVQYAGEVSDYGCY